MIQTWAAGITPLLEKECYQNYYTKAPLFRREKADRLQKQPARAQSIGVWALYEEMKAFYGLTGEEAYNFSHSGNYVLCSVCTEYRKSGLEIKVGCDVEQVGKVRLDLAARFFCRSEYQDIAKEEKEKRTELFYRYWVLKESFMKATGKGMRLGLDSFEICMADPPVLIRQPKNYQETYYYMESELEEGAYRVSVCSTDAEICPEIQVIRLGL